MSIPTNIYSTKDTALAAWLISQGFEPLELDNQKSNSVAFIFDNSHVDFNTAVKDFQSGKASGNILAFFRAYKRLLTNIRER